MARTCYYCDAMLGRNVVLAYCPDGVHVAFDVRAGRAWIVCGRCGRWNLVDGETQSLLVAECEARFAAVTCPDAVEGIGRAQVDGLHLTRLGGVDVPAYLEARHGARVAGRAANGRRLAAAVGLASVATSVPVALSVHGIAGGVLGASAALAGLAALGFIQRRRTFSLRRADGTTVRVRRGVALRSQLRGAHDGWALHVPSLAGAIVLAGTDALAAIARFIPIQVVVATPALVEQALSALESAGSADAYVRGLAKRAAPLASLSAPDLLALEIVATEARERRELRDAVDALRPAWRRATEEAGIAEGLLPPQPTISSGLRTSR